MNYGKAIELLKINKKVAREGWNGADMYVVLIHGGNACFHGYPMQDCFGLKTTRSEMQPGWVASISDTLATDWVEVK